jgi:hypothetical protein
MFCRGIILIFSLALISCATENGDKDEMEITGTIQKQGITTYQYGTHTISGFALRSSAVDLDDYINQEVIVIGHKIDGYPVDGGPEFIEVEKVK